MIPVEEILRAERIRVVNFKRRLNPNEKSVMGIHFDGGRVKKSKNRFFDLQTLLKDNAEFLFISNGIRARM